MILAGLISTVDSIFCAVSSVAGHDVVMRLTDGKTNGESVTINGKTFTSIQIARMVMVVVCVLAILVANIPGLTITYLFLFYGTLRSSVMLPTIFAINGKRMTERGIYYGIMASIVVGLPIFAIGNLNGNVAMIVTGSLLTIGLSGAISRLLPQKTLENTQE